MGVKNGSFGEFLLEPKGSLNCFLKSTSESAKKLPCTEDKPQGPSTVPPLFSSRSFQEETFWSQRSSLVPGIKIWPVLGNHIQMLSLDKPQSESEPWFWILFLVLPDETVLQFSSEMTFCFVNIHRQNLRFP